MDLNSYLKLSRRIIRRHADSHCPGLSKIMRRNEDAVADVAYWLMMADIKWNANCNKTQLNSWRTSQGRFAIQRYLEAATRKRNLSHAPLEEDEDNFRSLNPKRQEDLNYFESLQEKAGLTDIEKECLVLKFVEDCSSKKMAFCLTLSQEKTDTIYKTALRKVKKLYTCSYSLL